VNAVSGIVVAIQIARPTSNLEMAFDPRIPPKKQAFEMRLSGVLDTDQVEWMVDDQRFAKTVGAKFLWPISRGRHSVTATVWRPGQPPITLERQNFWVK
jgi:penicillin-binding protein 1C